MILDYFSKISATENLANLVMHEVPLLQTTVRSNVSKLCWLSLYFLVSASTFKWFVKSINNNMFGSLRYLRLLV